MNCTHILNRFRPVVLRCFISSIGLLVCSSAAFASSPTHRYSFESNADDSIGAAHGTLLGNAVFTNGALALNGVNGCVRLPEGMLTNRDSVSIEMWVALDTASSGARFYVFESFPTNGITFTAGSGNSARYYTAAVTQSVPTPLLATGKTNHIVWTQDQALHTARIFTNGVQSSQHPSFTLTPQIIGLTTNNYIGAYRTNSGVINGRILEFRVYPYALSSLEVSLTGQAGPDQLLQPQAVRLDAPPFVPLGSRPGRIFADFIHPTNVEITGLPGIAIATSDSNVVSITTDGAFKASGLGTATISVEYEGRSDSNSITVVPAEDFDLAHRYNFFGTPGQTNVPDLQSGADGVLFGGTYTNSGQLLLNGTSGYVDLPDGVLSSLSDVTIEAWVTRLSGGVLTAYWPRIFDFGSNSNGWGASYFFLTWSAGPTPTGPFRFAVSTNAVLDESPQLTTSNGLPHNIQAHLAVTYSPSRNTSTLYTNGVWAASGPAPTPLSLITDTNNWLGRSQYSQDAYFRGLLNEFRIYRSVLDDADIAASYALGSDVIGADFVIHPSVSGTNLHLFWGPTASSGVLKSTTSIGTDAVWTEASATPIFVNGHFEVTVPLSDLTRFYRLFTP